MSDNSVPAKPKPKSENVGAERSLIQPLQAENVGAEPLESQPLQSVETDAELSETQPLHSENVGAELTESQPLQLEEIEVEPTTTQPLQSEETESEQIKNTSESEQPESEQPEVEKPKTRLKKLLEERQAIDKRIKKQLAKEAAEKRKQETRQKILIGAAVQKQISKGKLTETWLLQILDAELTLEHDRKVFNLLPQTATVLPSADSQAIATAVSSAQATQPEELGMMVLAAATAAALSEA